MSFDILITGAGAVGGNAVEFLARRPEVRSIALIDINADVAQGVAWRATLGTLQEGKHVRIEGFGLNLLDQDAADELIGRIAPRVVFHTATLLTVPEMHRGLAPDVFERVRADGMSGFLTAHLVLATKVQRALAKLPARPPLVMASFPDFTNQVLTKMGHGPRIGIGNVDNLACELQAIVAQQLNVAARDVTPMVVAHHSVAEWFQRSGSAGSAPWFARVFVNGVDRSAEFDFDALMAESARRIRSVPQEQRTAASGVKAVLAILRDDGTYVHAAGAFGEPVGMPVRLWADRLERVDVPGCDPEEALRIALAGQRKGGVESIEADGTVVATERCVTMMRELFDIDVSRVTPDRIESTALALRAALTKAKIRP